ncbi:hypothetical protein KP509_28G070500 [Ceratopteris richardii]|uniref:Secreted protein n=1 Tax=Ceratopteris richardii TaxID=49495 RepID=A0A8T2REP1_CERRI|nr:hypothetical protein KP509_28G070500 [Ceratopteris richardii]
MKFTAPTSSLLITSLCLSLICGHHVPFSLFYVMRHRHHDSSVAHIMSKNLSLPAELSCSHVSPPHAQQPTTLLLSLSHGVRAPTLATDRQSTFSGCQIDMPSIL